MALPTPLPTPLPTATPQKDALFGWFERFHGARPWGDVLDAGTGEHSLGWLASVPARSLTAVTVEDWRTGGLQAAAPAARLVFGQWTDPALLHGEAFDVTLVDYVIGAIDGHAPYFQYGFLKRLRPHVGRAGAPGRVYLVGMEPPPRDGSVLDEVARVRDACILLAGHRCYREYPRDIVLSWLAETGYRVLESEVMPTVLGQKFIDGQLDVAQRKLRFFRDRALATAMAGTIAALRERALQGAPYRWGADYVVAAEGS